MSQINGPVVSRDSPRPRRKSLHEKLLKTSIEKPDMTKEQKLAVIGEMRKMSAMNSYIGRPQLLNTRVRAGTVSDNDEATSITIVGGAPD